MKHRKPRLPWSHLLATATLNNSGKPRLPWSNLLATATLNNLGKQRLPWSNLLATATLNNSGIPYSRSGVALGLGLLTAILATVHMASSTRADSMESDSTGTIWGTWVVALDASPFGIPGGVLPGLMTIHRDGTLIISDGGDIGSFPFTTTDTSQHGVWVQADDQTFKATTLFLRKDEISGDLEGWHRVHFTLQFAEDADHLDGVAEEEVLLTDPNGPTPFPLLNAPDPITSEFSPSPFPIPIALTRLQVN